MSLRLFDAAYSAPAALLLRRHARHRGGTICSMPLTLEDLEAAAWACRAMATQKERDAAAIENPTVRAPLEQASKRYGDLARRFEAAARVRKQSTRS